MSSFLHTVFCVRLQLQTCERFQITFYIYQSACCRNRVFFFFFLNLLSRVIKLWRSLNLEFSTTYWALHLELLLASHRNQHSLCLWLRLRTTAVLCLLFAVDTMTLIHAVYHICSVRYIANVQMIDDWRSQSYSSRTTRIDGKMIFNPIPAIAGCAWDFLVLFLTSFICEAGGMI